MRELQRCKTIASCSSSKRGNIPLFPEEMIFNILIWLPADVLYDCMRFVCRQWHAIINSPLFIEEHIHRSSSDFLFSHTCNEFSYLAKLGESSANVIKTSLPPFFNIYATCDGLAIVTHCMKVYHVVNVLTRSAVTLPPITDRMPHNYSFSLVRSRTMNCYKVVLSYFHTPKESSLEIVSLTLNKDHVWTPMTCRDALALHYSDMKTKELETLGIDGTIYWIVREGSVIFALDVDTEELHEFPFPPLVQKEYNARHFMVAGKSLALVVSFELRTILDFWQVTSDFQWRKLYHIDLRGIVSYPKNRYEVNLLFGSIPIFPVACVNSGEVVIFRNYESSCNSFISYNLKSGKAFCFGSFDISFSGSFFNFTFSLVKLHS